MEKTFHFKAKGPDIIKVALVVLFLMVLSMVIGETFWKIHKRFTLDPYIYIHDGAMQTEEAAKFLFKGRNPYAENYFGTPLENRGGLAELDFFNPAIYHFVYLPFNILFSLPFLASASFFMHWFDERLVYIFSFLLFIATILSWPEKSLKRKLVFLSLFMISPWFFVFFADGRNDIFVFSWIALAVYFLDRKKYDHSSIFLALAAASKQSSWILLPFCFAYLYYQQSEKTNIYGKIKKIFKMTYLFFAVSAIIIAPFLIWDFNSLIDDIIKYPNGTAFMSYPISGFGFSRLLLEMNLVSSPNVYWPFWIPQLIFGAPLFFILLKLQKNNNTLSQMIFNYSLLLMTFWLFSRFFNDNYIGFLIMLFLLAVYLIKPQTKLPAN